MFTCSLPFAFLLQAAGVASVVGDTMRADAVAEAAAASSSRDVLAPEDRLEVCQRHWVMPFTHSHFTMVRATRCQAHMFPRSHAVLLMFPCTQDEVKREIHVGRTSKRRRMGTMANPIEL